MILAKLVKSNDSKKTTNVPNMVHVAQILYIDCERRPTNIHIIEQLYSVIRRNIFHSTCQYNAVIIKLYVIF